MLSSEFLFMGNAVLNLFYQEPDPDRWFPYDRYPRKMIRQWMRGRPRPGGQMRVYLNLVAGLDQLGHRYRFNDFAYAQRHPEELVCIIGKPAVLFERKWKNPVLFGASVFSHPLDCPDLFERYPVEKMLVPGEWMRRMCEPYYGKKVMAWPVGIDTDQWKPAGMEKTVDILIYDKIRWERAHYENVLGNPIREHLKANNLKIEILRYGHYQPADLREKLNRSKAALFLCEHETQGLAYQQMLSSGVPVFAWNRGGYWQDPAYYPHRVEFAPVSSVPYWDERCGMTFEDLSAFKNGFDAFWGRVQAKSFDPRAYILENLTLEKCAQAYVDIAQSIEPRSFTQLGL